jgi:hypothetical protein
VGLEAYSSGRLLRQDPESVGEMVMVFGGRVGVSAGEVSAPAICAYSWPTPLESLRV